MYINQPHHQPHHHIVFTQEVQPLHQVTVPEGYANHTLQELHATATPHQAHQAHNQPHHHPHQFALQDVQEPFHQFHQFACNVQVIVHTVHNITIAHHQPHPQPHQLLLVQLLQAIPLARIVHQDIFIFQAHSTISNHHQAHQAHQFQAAHQPHQAPAEKSLLVILLTWSDNAHAAQAQGAHQPQPAFVCNANKLFNHLLHAQTEVHHVQPIPSKSIVHALIVKLLEHFITTIPFHVKFNVQPVILILV